MLKCFAGFGISYWTWGRARVREAPARNHHGLTGESHSLQCRPRDAVRIILAHLDPVCEGVPDGLVVLEPRGRQAGDVGVGRAAEKRLLPGCEAKWG